MQARALRRSELHPGMTFLLEVASGNVEAISIAKELTGRTDHVLSRATSFYIEQVLLSETADCYRVLGATSTTPHKMLHRHMILLMKWVHPDVAHHNDQGSNIDRSVFATRISQAWDQLKTPEKRAAYDISQQKQHPKKRSRRSRMRRSQRQKLSRARQPIVFTWYQRLWYRVWGHRQW